MHESDRNPRSRHSASHDCKTTEEPEFGPYIAMLSGEKVYDCDDQNDVLGSSEEVYINEAVATVGKMTKGLNHVACVRLGRYTTCERPVRSCSAGKELINPPICEQSYDLDKAALNGESEKKLWRYKRDLIKMLSCDARHWASNMFSHALLTCLVGWNCFQFSILDEKQDE